MALKNYLSAKDMNDLLYVSHLLEINDRFLRDAKEHETITKEEAKSLKMALTWSEKFMKQVLSRMPQKEIKKFLKRTIKSKNEPIRVLDKWMHDRVFGAYETEYEIIKIERPQFESLCFALIQEHCKDCNNDYQYCDIYDIFEDNLVPRCEHKKNCAYAFYSPEALEEIARQEAIKEAEREAKKAKKSKRAKKKKANKFDEDDEIIEYNFTPKGVK